MFPEAMHNCLLTEVSLLTELHDQRLLAPRARKLAHLHKQSRPDLGITNSQHRKEDEATQLVLAQWKFYKNKNIVRYFDGYNHIN